jgi:hypothetical protein
MIIILCFSGQMCNLFHVPGSWVKGTQEYHIENIAGSVNDKKQDR